MDNVVIYIHGKDGRSEEAKHYEQLGCDRNNDRLLIPNGLRFICEAYHYDAEKIGQHFLEELPRICPKEE